MKNLRKLLLPLLIAVSGIVFATMAVKTVQTYESRLDFEKTSGDFLSDTENTLKEREEVLQELNAFNDRISARVVYNLSYLVDFNVKTNNRAQLQQLQLDFLELSESSGMDELYLTDAEGKIFCAYDPELCGRYLTEDSLFGKDNWELLMDEGSWEDELLGMTFNVNGEERRYYAIAYSEEAGKYDWILIGGEKTELGSTILEYLKDFSISFSNLTSYDEIAAFAVNADTGKVIYASSELEEFLDKDISEVVSGDITAFNDGEVNKTEIGGTSRLLVLRRYESEIIGNWIFGCVSTKQSAAMSNFYLWAALVMFAMVIFALISLQSQQKTGRKKMFRKFGAVLPATLIFTFVLLFYIYSMSSASLAMEQMKVNSETFAEAYVSNRSLTSAVEEFYKNRYVDILNSSAEYLEVNGDYVMDEELGTAVNFYQSRDEKGTVTMAKDVFGNPLKSISENQLLIIMTQEMGQDRMMLFNSSGRTISTSDSNWYFEIKNCEEGFKEELLDVLDRKSSFFYRIAENSGEDGDGEMISCFATPITLYLTKDEDGNTVYLSRSQYEEKKAAGDSSVKTENGLLYAESITPMMIYLSDRAIAENTMNSIRPAQNSRMALLETDGGSFICSSDDLNEKTVAGLSFSEEDHGKESYRFENVGSERVFAGLIPTGEGGDYELLTLFPSTDVFFGRLPVCLTGMLSMLAVLIVLGIYYVYKEEPGEVEDEQEKKVILPQNMRRSGNFSDYFSGLNSEERIGGFIRIVFFIVFILLLIRLADRTGNNAGCLAFHYTVGKTWPRELSLFSVSFAFYILVIVITVISVLRKLVSFFMPILGAATETIVRLVISMAEYICVIVLIFYNLYLFGVQMGTVLTSASIMTIVVGLGANSLIGDVLAGLFIIMEQEFKVGDIVTIDGFTGFVRNIGLRTTKVQDFSGNIKTFNNAKINGVLNLTDNYTTFFVTMNINIDVPVETIEELVEKELTRRMKGNEDLVAGPWFSGIPDVKGNVYTISIGASSLQQKSWSLRKKIIQEMLILLKEKGIPLS